MTVCLGLLCGIPGSGKSTTAHQMKAFMEEKLQMCVLLIQYDTLIPQQMEEQLIQSLEQGGSRWKSARRQVIDCVDCLAQRLSQISASYQETFSLQEVLGTLRSQYHHSQAALQNRLCLLQPEKVDLDLWERFVLAVDDSLDSVALSHNTMVAAWLVLIDDNLAYSSMRYQFCQIARQHETGLCVFYVSCPLEEAVRRNSNRAAGKVAEHVITLMHQRFEPPDSGKRPWEKHACTIDATTDIDMPSVAELVERALREPQRRPPEEDAEGQAVSRYVCSTNTLHQADQILRRCVSSAMSRAKEVGANRDNLKVLSSQLAKARSLILADLKSGETTLPFKPEDNICDASKDSTSALYHFIASLFTTRTSDV